jgi:GT2 family glycosyltransferase
MTAAPTLAVLLAVHDQRPFLGQAIGSILGQSHRAFEFVIVDDGSTDGSRGVIEAAAQQDSRVRPIFLGKNLGLGGALQAGLAVITADIVARMDGDDVAQPDRLHQQMAAMAGQQCDVLGSGYFRLSEALDAQPRGLRVPMQGHDNIIRNLPYANVICHPSVMFRRRVIEAAGGYDPRFVFAQDYDLWLRLIGRARFGNLPDGLLQMRRHDARSSGPQNRLHHTQFSVTAATNHFLRHSGQKPLDPKGTLTALARTLEALLLAHAKDPVAHQALVRHATRLMRNAPPPPEVAEGLKAAVWRCAGWQQRLKWWLYRLG